MTATIASSRILFPAWQGCVRAGSGFPAGARRSGSCLEIGAAVFVMPEPSEATTTTWTLSQDQFCVFTGFLHNRNEIALDLAGQVAGSASPAEVVLEAYRNWGSEVARRLDGKFAWAIWDQPRNLLLCGRDPMGLHPFYYSLVKGGLVFSWDLETLRSHPDVPRDLDRVVLAEHLNYRWMDQQETPFVAVRRLPGGHGMTWQSGRLNVFRYWEPIPEGGPIQWLNREDLAAFPTLLQKAVDRSMQYGPPGIFLSGGFDSVSIAAWAAEIARARNQCSPRAFCLIFPGPEDQEERIQRAVSKALGFPATFRHMADCLNGRGLLGRNLDLMPVCPSPPTHTFKPAYIELARQARLQGCAVVLTGEGGDEWLTVTPAYAADLIRSADMPGLLRLLQTSLRSWKLPKLAVTRSVLWSYGLRALIRDRLWRRFPRAAMARRRRLLADAVPAWMAPDPALRRQLAERFNLWDRPGEDDNFYLNAIRLSHLNPVTPMSFEESFYRDAFSGVPSLTPYWDRPLVDFLLRVPPKLLNAGGRSKALVRRALAERFPQLGFERLKKESAVEFSSHVYRTEGPQLWQELGRAGCLAELGIVDLNKFHEHMGMWLKQGTTLPLHRIWHGASVEGWIRVHR